MIRIAAVLACSLFCTLPATAGDRMSPELLWKLGRLSGGTISPDGEWVAYSVRRYELAENKGNSDLFLVPLKGGETKALTVGPESESDVQWVDTPTGAQLFFTSKRGEDKASQVWSLDPSGGEPVRRSNVEGGVANLKVSPTGTHVAFTVDVKLDDTVQDLHPDLPKADARIIDDLLYRHWDSWSDYKYSHLCVAPIGDDGQVGEYTDLMEGQKLDCPVPPFGGSEQFHWSPDGKTVAYTTKIAEVPARSTDTSIWLVDIDDPASARDITAGRPGYDMEPLFSPDSRYIAFLSMERAGFEADRNRILLHDWDTGELSELTVGLDQTCHDLLWAPDSSALYFRSERLGTEQLFRLTVADAALLQVTDGAWNWSLRDATADGGTLLVARQNMLRPWELGTLSGTTFKPLTDVNGDVFANLELPTVHERWVEATDGKQIHNWLILPPDFDESKQWPLLVYCQGGPQGQIGQWFSYRWNFHLMAAQGYAVLAVNRRGLPGFGQDWNDQISGDWGGQAMKDILSATDEFRAKDWVDDSRLGAIGASFGGYTAYWMMGHHEDRYATIISHAGLFNLESFYAATEETFFPDWDVGGPYWESEALQKEYDENSPNRAVANWKTPLLIIHGEKDYRVPINQALEAFTAAKIQGAPVRFLYYPGEGHWILGPQNGVLWHRTFFSWLDQWIGDGAGGQ